MGILRGVFELNDLSPDAAVEVLSPYQPLSPWPAPSAALIRGFGPASGAGADDWQLTIEWIGTLELAVDAPGCEVVTIRCDVTDCSIN